MHHPNGPCRAARVPSHRLAVLGESPQLPQVLGSKPGLRAAPAAIDAWISAQLYVGTRRTHATHDPRPLCVPSRERGGILWRRTGLQAHALAVPEREQPHRSAPSDTLLRAFPAPCSRSNCDDSPDRPLHVVRCLSGRRFAVIAPCVSTWARLATVSFTNAAARYLTRAQPSARKFPDPATLRQRVGRRPQVVPCTLSNSPKRPPGRSVPESTYARFHQPEA